MSQTLPEADRIQGAPHPRETQHLFGQEPAEAEFLEAWSKGRLHHGWMLTGPKGVGKATLAWRIARFLLSQDENQGGGLFGEPQKPDTLDSDPESPVARRMRALAEPRLALLRRGLNDKETALSQFITVKDVRKMKEFFGLSSADGGYRVAIVDSVDDMNPAAANALLKLLEEPPARTIFFLISHQPSKLLPTIRSRCRLLKLSPLNAQNLSDALVQAGAEISPEERQPLAELAAGSVRVAFELTNLKGLESYKELVGLLASLPRLDRPRALALAESVTAKGAEERFDMVLGQVDLLLSRLSRAAATRQTPPEAAPGEAALFARLAPHLYSAKIWAELAQTLTLRARQGKAVNLDPAALIMDTLLRIDATAGRIGI